MKKNLYSGIKVLDMTNNLAGPATAAMLSDYGAEVIHVEKPVLGDDARGFMPIVDGEGTSHMRVNRNKKSLVLDLKNPECIKIIKELLKDTDILIESFRPGVMERLGLGYEAVKEVKPDIIYCSVSAFGQKGPYATMPGYDVIAQAYSTLMYMTGEPDGSPTKIGGEVGDWSSGITAFGAIGHAMYNRERTGEGMHIDIALVRVLLYMSARFDYLITGEFESSMRSGNKHKTLCPYGVFDGKDGQSIVIGAINQNTWIKLCDAMGRQDLAEDERYISNAKRCERLDEVSKLIEDWLKTYDDIEDVEKLLREKAVPCAKVYNHKDAYEDPHFNECGWIGHIPVPDGVTTISERPIPAPPFSFSGYEPVFTKAPKLGQHNHEILEKLGYTAEQVDEMEAEWAKPKPKK